MKDNLKDLLNTYQVPDSNKKMATTKLAQDRLNKQPITPSFWGQVWNQFAYISPRLLIFQLILTVSLLLFLEGETSGGLMIIYCVSYSFLLCLTVLPEIMKSFTYSMWQMEKTCLFKFEHLILLRSFILGIVELIFLSIASFSMAYFTETPFLTTCLHFIAPFTVVSGIGLSVANIFKQRLSIWSQQAITSLVVLLLIKGVDISISFSAITTIQWLLVMFAGSLLSIVGMRMLLRNGGKQLWN